MENTIEDDSDEDDACDEQPVPSGGEDDADDKDDPDGEASAEKTAAQEGVERLEEGSMNNQTPRKSAHPARYDPFLTLLLKKWWLRSLLHPSLDEMQMRFLARRAA